MISAQIDDSVSSERTAVMQYSIVCVVLLAGTLAYADAALAHGGGHGGHGGHSAGGAPAAAPGASSPSEAGAASVPSTNSSESDWVVPLGGPLWCPRRR